LPTPQLLAGNTDTILLVTCVSQQYDLVLLDIVMPTMDGVEVLTTMQSDKNLVDIPVAMLSGLEDEMLANVCLESGAIAVLQKPLDTAEVQELIMSKGITRRRTTSRR
jgi:CheY-like chemotaxis protein